MLAHSGHLQSKLIGSNHRKGHVPAKFTRAINTGRLDSSFQQTFKSRERNKPSKLEASIQSSVTAEGGSGGGQSSMGMV